MIWKKYTIETNVEAADIVASVLFDNNIIGAEIEDNTNLSDEDLKKMYVDIPVKKIDDGKAKVSFYVAINDNLRVDIVEDVNVGVDPRSTRNIIDDSYRPSTDNIFTEAEFEGILNSIKNGLDEYKDFMDMGSLKITIEELDDNVFLNKWKENFKRLEIDDIVICPSWEKEGDNDDSKIKIYIEPGNAFGTGQHATTKLCVRAIKDVIFMLDANELNIVDNNKDLSLLDIGCGSGILGIVGKKLGVKNICLVDVDESVEFNLLENCKLNSVDFSYEFGNLIDDKDLRIKAGFGKYDIVVANILAPVICSLLGMGEVDKFLKPGGYFICSGILKEKEPDVVAAINKNGHFTIETTLSEADWVCIICKKKC